MQRVGKLKLEKLINIIHNNYALDVIDNTVEPLY